MKMNDTRMTWDYERKTWFVHATIALKRDQLLRIAAWALPIQRQRWRGMLPGPRKDALYETIVALEQGHIESVLCPQVNPEGTVFAATTRSTPVVTSLPGV